jgi:hypothetical protein
MGPNCGEARNPDITNQCSTSINETIDLPHFCTYAGPAGDDRRREWCGKIGESGGEWEWSGSQSGICGYNDCHPYQNAPIGCCSGCCTISGAGAICRRKQFLGDPLQCCLNDYACNQDKPGLCFTDASKSHTCDPSQRDIAGAGCSQTIQSYCSGTLPTDDPNSTEWIRRWVDINNNPVPNGCLYALRRYLFAQPGSPCLTGNPGTGCSPDTSPINAEGFPKAQALIAKVFEQYNKQGFSVGALPGTPGFNPFQDFLYCNVCGRYPGLCQTGLKSICQQYTAQRLTFNPPAANWCGCFLPDGEYAKYVNRYQISKECTPMCNRAGTIPVTDGSGQAIPCKQQVCLIDDLTINLVNTTVGGAVNIGQVCASCQNGSSGSAQCNCIIENNTIDAVQARIGGNVVVSQACGSTVCTRTNPNPGNGAPETLTVPCTGSSDPFTQYNERVVAAQNTATRHQTLIILIVILVALVIIFIAIMIIRPGASFGVAAPIIAQPRAMAIQGGVPTTNVVIGPVTGLQAPALTTSVAISSGPARQSALGGAPGRSAALPANNQLLPGAPAPPFRSIFTPTK